MTNTQVAEDALCYIKATARGRSDGNFPIAINRDIVYKFKPYCMARLDEQQDERDDD